MQNKVSKSLEVGKKYVLGALSANFFFFGNFGVKAKGVEDKTTQIR